MRVKRNQQRVLYASLVLIAFFVPAYGKESAFQLIILTLGSAGSDSEITLVDVLIVLLPLLMIPFAAVLILVRAVYKKPQNSFLLSLPFFSIAFSFLTFSLHVSRQADSVSLFGLLRQMSIGFYLAALASLLLLVSYSRNELLNLSSRHR